VEILTSEVPTGTMEKMKIAYNFAFRQAVIVYFYLLHYTVSQKNVLTLKRYRTICKSLAIHSRQITTPELTFYKLDALPDDQPTVSKHCEKIIYSIITEHYDCSR